MHHVFFSQQSSNETRLVSFFLSDGPSLILYFFVTVQCSTAVLSVTDTVTRALLFYFFAIGCYVTFNFKTLKRKYGLTAYFYNKTPFYLENFGKLAKCFIRCASR